MPGPEGSSSGGPAGPVPPQQQSHQHMPHSNSHLDASYPSLAFQAGPSQPQQQQHFQHQQQWGGYPYYQQYPQPGGPQRPQPNGGSYPPQFHPNFQPFHYPPQFFPQYGHMPVPGPGPGTMQNQYYMGGGNFPRYPYQEGEPPNGDDGAGGFPQGMPFPQQQMYPAGHPYAYGGGIGYQQQQMPFQAAGAYRPDGFMQDQHQPPIAHQPKGLNPAAQGFQYQARKSESLANGNGNMPNGNAEPQSHTPEILAPVPEKASSGSLGLSLEPAAQISESTPVPEDPPSEKPATPSPPAAEPVAEANETLATPQKQAEETPAAEVEAKSSAPVEEKEEPKKSNGGQGLKFTGATLAGVMSPPATKASKPTRPRADDPILCCPSRPSVDSDRNAYASYLASRIPDCVSVEHEAGVERKRSTKGKPKPRGRGALFILGRKGGRAVPPVTLVFGTIADAPSTPSTPVIPSTPLLASPPPAVPRIKPASWAALLRKDKPKGTPDGSVGPSSTLVSPSKSIMSLPSEAGPPATPSSPRSTAPSLPPSVSGGPSAPRPVFNYAAAAAVGAPLSPAEDLARLLTEGMRTRNRHPAQVVPRGLINTGNMCFANTILQVLVYCTPFTELFEELGKRLKADLARRTPLLEAMIIFLREFAPGPSTYGGSGTSTPKGKSREDAFVPENVYDAMKENKRFDSMRRGFQEDAEEYLGFFLNTLHEELLAMYSRTQPPRAVAKTANGTTDERQIGRPVSPGAADSGDDWLEVGKKQRTHVVRAAESKESAVSRIFGGTLRSVLHAPGQKDSVTLEPYQPLQLDIQGSQVMTLVDALKHLNEPEVVPGVFVQARGTTVDATKQVYFESFPQVLILHLKRFVYDPQEQNVVKRSKPVAYGTDLVIPQDIISPPKRTSQPVRYALFGVVYHHGYSATGGHYTVAVSRPGSTDWLHFDDEVVQPVPVNEVVVSEDEARNGRAGQIGGRERCAYLLFYQRVR